MLKNIKDTKPMRGGADFKIGSDSVFWCEHPDVYLRRVGFADQYAGIRHNGWFLDDDIQDEVARGVVFQLPGRDGKPRFMYGIADPFNDGPAILAHDIVDDKDDAARWADSLAETYAENERDYHRASAAGLRHSEIPDDIKRIRQVALRLLSTRRSGDMALGGDNLIVMEVRKARREIAELIEERERLESDFGREPGFKDV